MPHVKILIDGKTYGFMTGKDGIKNVFTDKEDHGTVVVLSENGITTYHGFPFILEKEYKEKY